MEDDISKETNDGSECEKTVGSDTPSPGVIELCRMVGQNSHPSLWDTIEMPQPLPLTNAMSIRPRGIPGAHHVRGPWTWARNITTGNPQERRSLIDAYVSWQHLVRAQDP